MKDPTSWIEQDDDIEDIERHKRERVENGFSVYDWWNFCDYMAWVNIQALEKFKTGHGFPAALGGMDEWVVVLDKMIAGFKAHLDIQNMTTDNYQKSEEVKKSGLELYAKYFSSLWD